MTRLVQFCQPLLGKAYSPEDFYRLQYDSAALDHLHIQIVAVRKAKRKEEPGKPFTGKFVLRLTPDLHRKVYIAAKKSGSSLNSWILQTLEHSTEHVS